MALEVTKRMIELEDPHTNFLYPLQDMMWLRNFNPFSDLPETIVLPASFRVGVDIDQDPAFWGVVNQHTIHRMH